MQVGGDVVTLNETMPFILIFFSLVTVSIIFLDEMANPGNIVS